MEKLLLRWTLRHPPVESDLHQEVHVHLDQGAKVLALAKDLPRALRVELLLRVLAGQKTYEQMAKLLRDLDKLQGSFADLGMEEPRQAFSRYYRTNPFQRTPGRAPLDALGEFVSSRKRLTRVLAPILKQMQEQDRKTLLSQSDLLALPLNRAVDRAVQLTVGRALVDSNETDRVIIERIQRELEAMGEVDQTDFEAWKAKNQLVALLDFFQKNIANAKGDIQTAIAYADAARKISEPEGILSSLSQVDAKLSALEMNPAWPVARVVKMRNQVGDIHRNVGRYLQDPKAKTEVKQKVLGEVQKHLDEIRKDLRELYTQGSSFTLMEISEFAFDTHVSGQKLIELGEALSGLSALEQTNLLYDFLMEYQGVKETATTDKKESRAEEITKPDLGDTRREASPEPVDEDKTGVAVPQPHQGTTPTVIETPPEVTPGGLLDGTIHKALALKPLSLDDAQLRARDATRINPMASARGVSTHVLKGGLMALVGLETLSASPQVAHAADPTSPNTFPLSEAMSFTECLQNFFLASVDWVAANPGILLFGMALTGALAAVGRFRGVIRSQVEAFLDGQMVAALEGPRVEARAPGISPAQEVGPFIAEMESLEPAFKGKLRPEDFTRKEASYYRRGYCYDLEPSPERAQELLKILVDAHNDHFPELDIHPHQSPEETVSRLKKFLPFFQKGDREMYGSDLMHCGGSAAALVYLLRLKGFEAFSVSLDTRFIHSDGEAAIAQHGRLLKKFSEKIGLNPAKAKYLILSGLGTEMSQEDLQETAEDYELSLEQTQRANEVYSQLSEGEREILEYDKGWGHAVAGVKIGDGYYLIDINGEQFGDPYAPVAFVPEAEATEKGFILSETLAKQHRTIPFERIQRDLDPSIELIHTKIRKIMLERSWEPAAETKAPKTKLSPLERLQTLAAQDPELAKDPVKLLNRYLLGQLDGEPRVSEVRELVEELESRRWSVEDRGNMVANPEVGPPIFEIYTKEILDAMATYLVRLAEEFHKTHGREPVIMEIAAGDGRLSAGLNSRLASKGLKIQPTDLGMDNKWKVSFGKEVTEKDARQVAQEADIILGSWLPYENDFDLEVAQAVAQDPKKTLILMGGGGHGVTGSTAFWDYVSPSNGNVREGFVDGLDFTSDGEHLPTSRLDFADRSTERTYVTVYRSPEAPENPNLTPEEVVSDWGISSPKTMDEETTAPGVIPAEARTQSNLPPQGAAYAVGAPVAMFVTLTSQGVNMGLALLAAAASAVFSSPAILGVFSGLLKGKQPLSEPQYFSPPAGKNSFTLGRHLSNDFQLDPKDKNISRVHATVQLGPDGKWYIWDGGERPSAN
ncbi:MAG: FHA domain-containing protein, partial [bacterium]|nr:FHA domain-containing protein [bacterium]